MLELLVVELLVSELLELELLVVSLDAESLAEAELIPAATIVTPIALASTLPTAIAAVVVRAALRPRSLAFMLPPSSGDTDAGGAFSVIPLSRHGAGSTSWRVSMCASCFSRGKMDV